MNTATVSTAGIEGAIVRHMNRDIDGSDYLVLRNADLNGCQSQCRSDARCQAFTFNTWENICFLKSSANVMRVEPRGISGVRATANVRPAVRPPTIERVPGRQFPEAPYRVTFQTNYDACAWRCTAEDQCLGFNYRRSDGFCGFFAGLAKSVPAYGTDVGMKWQPPYDPTVPPRRRAVHPWRDMPSEAAIFFDSVIRQIAR